MAVNSSDVTAVARLTTPNPHQSGYVLVTLARPSAITPDLLIDDRSNDPVQPVQTLTLTVTAAP